jgi:hypothetical protein
MEDVFVEPRSADPRHDEATARRLERLAWLMDRAFTIPGTKVSFGLDALLGLLPVGGDVLTGIVQAGLVLVALGQYRVPRTVAARMMANVLVDVAVGAIPILGDLFDVAFKANTRNLRLLEPYRHREPVEARPIGRYAPLPIDIGMGGTSWRYLLPIAVVLLAALVLVFIGFVTVVRWIVRG